MFLVPFLEYSCYEYFPEIRSKGGSFVKYLLWHQNYFVMDYLAPPPFLNLSPPPPIMSYPPINFQIFSTLSFSSILKNPSLPFVNGWLIKSINTTKNNPLNVSHIPIVYMVPIISISIEQIMRVN